MMVNKRFKSLFALMIVFSMLSVNFNFLSDSEVFADISFGNDEKSMIIKEIRYQKNYDEYDINSSIITIIGKNLDSNSIKFKMRGGSLVSFTKSPSSDDFSIQYILPTYAGPQPPLTYDKDFPCVENFTGSIQIEDKEIDILKNTNIPSFTKADKFDVIQDKKLPSDSEIQNDLGTNPPHYILDDYSDTSQKITLYGSNLENINKDNTKFTVKYGNTSESNADEFKVSGKFQGGSGHNQRYTFIPKTNGDLGYRNIWVTYKSEVGVVGDPTFTDGKVKLSIENVYINCFRILEDFTLKDVRIIPNKGQKGGYVQIFADNFGGYNNLNQGKDLYGVYFLNVNDTTDDLDSYKESPEVTLSYTNDHLLVKIPNSAQFTNGIKRVVIFRKQNGLNIGRFEVPERFQVEDSHIEPKITSINPKSGPNSGTEVQINGINLVNPKMAGLEVIGNQSDDFEVETATLNNEGSELIINYKTDYSLTNPEDKRRLLYNRRYVKSLQRKIRVTVGETSEFVKLDPPQNGKAAKLVLGDDYDEIYVVAKQDLTYTQTNPTQPVNMYIETIIETEKDYVVPELNIDKLEKYYDGNRIINEDISASAQISGKKVEGKINIISDTSKCKAPGSYIVNVEFVPTKINKFESIIKAMRLVIAKAKVEKEVVINALIPKVSEDNKKLSEITISQEILNNNKIIAGTFKWNLSPNTIIKKGKKYAWTYIPNNKDYYQAVSGNIILYPENPSTKVNPTVTVNDIIKNYDGNKILDDDITGTAVYGDKQVKGVFKILSYPNSAGINVGSYNIPVRFYPDDNDKYTIVDGSMTLKINKAIPEIKEIVNNAIEKVYKDNTKLEDITINLDPNVPEANSGNGFTWNVSGTAIINKGEEYTWRYTPKDASNYSEVSSKLVLYPDLENYDHVSSYTYNYHNETSYESFTFKESSMEPNISALNPESVQVEYVDDLEKGVKVKNRTLLSLEGDKFFVNKYTRKDGSVRVNYPIVQVQTGSYTGIGDYLIKFDPNEEIEEDGKKIRGTIRDYNGDIIRYQSGDKLGEPVKLEMEFLTENGVNLDGVKNTVGQRILIYMPVEVELPSKGYKNIQVINPSIGNDGLGGKAVAENIIEFKVSNKNDFPSISSVEPNVVVVDSESPVIVRGANFKDGVRVFIDGIEVEDVERIAEFQSPGWRLEFKAPKGRVGKTQLLVMNPTSGADKNGACDIADFYYIESFANDPKIFSINPPKGSRDTFVTVFGNNFFDADPAVKDAEGLNIYKLIGSRLIIDGNDVNRYNLDEAGKIILKDYQSNADDLILSTKFENGSNNAILNKFASAVVLYDENIDKYFVIDKRFDGKIILSDGIDRKFEVKAKGANAYIAIDKKENRYNLEISEEGIKIPEKNLNLKMLTAFEVDKNTNEITGKKSWVRSKDILEFFVPILYTGQGLKDVKIVNPDTQFIEKKKGFEYLIPSDPFPKVISVSPNRGPSEGGYWVDIKCENMVHSEEFPVRVDFGGVKVSEEDIKYNPLTKVLEVKVPKYPKDIGDVYGTSEFPVTVSVVRSDGASAYLKDAFTYVKVQNKPVIISLSKDKGTANGGEAVKILVKNLRFKEPFKDENVNGKYDVNEPFQDLNGNGKFDDLTKLVSQNEIIKLINKLDGGAVYADLNNREKEIYDLLGVKAFTILDKFGVYRHYYTSPIMPVVRFGSKKAKIVEFTKGALDKGYIKVITPPNPEGETNVVVSNCDAGVSEPVTYTYTSSAPEIAYAVPNEGRRTGGEKIDIYGSKFYKKKIESYTKDGSIKQNKKVDSLIRFGDLTNEFIKPGEKNDGDINWNFATVALDGGLQVKVDLGEKTISVRLEEGKRVYKALFENYDGRDVFIPLGLLKDGSDYYVPNAYDKSKDVLDTDGYNKSNDYELIRVRMVDNNSRVIVSRGFSPDAQGLSDDRIELKTPSYYDIGKVNLYFFNPDGGVAKSEFTYTNPASKPIIETCTPNRVVEANSTENQTNRKQRFVEASTQGGAIIFLKGKDFREGVKVFIGEKEIEILDFTSEGAFQTIKLRVPEADKDLIGKKMPFILKNKDGGIAVSDDIKKLGIDKRLLYFVYRKPLSLPTLKEIMPKKTSQFGGHKIKVTGEDIRDGATIVLGTEGELPVVVKEIDKYGKYITFITPKGLNYGKTDVQVKNADFGLDTMKDGLEIISHPVLDSEIKDGKNQTIVKVATTEGKQIITLKGKNFMEGAKVYFGGERTEAKNSKKKGVKGFTKDDKYVILSNAIESPKVEFVDENTLKVETPKVTNEKVQKISVINPDEGINDEGLKLKFSLPKPSESHSLKATVVGDKYIKLYDYVSENVKYYTVYAYMGNKSASRLKNDKYRDFKSLETTNREPYKISNLEGFDKNARNNYLHFVVKAVNDFGSSNWSNIATLRYSDYKNLSFPKDDKIKTSVKVDKSLEGKVNVNIQNKKAEIGFNSPLQSLSKTKLGFEETSNVKDFELLFSKYIVNNSADVGIETPLFYLTVNPKSYAGNVFNTQLKEKGAYGSLNVKWTEDYNTAAAKSKLKSVDRRLKTVSPMIKANVSAKTASANKDIGKLNQAFKVAYKLNAPDVVYDKNKAIYLYKYNLKSGRWTRQNYDNLAAAQLIRFYVDESAYYVLCQY